VTNEPRTYQMYIIGTENKVEVLVHMIGTVSFILGSFVFVFEKKSKLNSSILVRNKIKQIKPAWINQTQIDC
jgi:hypothetical protein